MKKNPLESGIPVLSPSLHLLLHETDLHYRSTFSGKPFCGDFISVARGFPFSPSSPCPVSVGRLHSKHSSYCNLSSKTILDMVNLSVVQDRSGTNRQTGHDAGDDQRTSAMPEELKECKSSDCNSPSKKSFFYRSAFVRSSALTNNFFEI